MIRLYLLGLKAFIALKELPDEYDALIDNIIIGQDSKVKKDYSHDIVKEAVNRGIPYYYRQDEPSEEAPYACVIGWRWLIKSNTNLIIFHDSLLPKYRGFNPLVSALINGDSEIGVTALKGAALFDSGDIFHQWKIGITYPIKIEKAIEAVSKGYASLLQRIFLSLSSSEVLDSCPQAEEDVSYSVWRDEEDYFIDWSWNVTKIKRFIDAVGYPYDGARARLADGTVVKILESQVWSIKPVTNPGYGKVLLKEGNCPIVVGGQGLIKLIEIRDLSEDKIELPKKLRYRFL